MKSTTAISIRCSAGSFVTGNCSTSGTSHQGNWRTGKSGPAPIFVRRGAFEAIGGFADLDLFENLDFSRRLKRLGKVVTLKPPVLGPARRFERRGPLATSLVDVWLTIRYLCGADPDRLARALRQKSSAPTAPAV